MNKVLSINLGGRAYQIEEAGYDRLHSYLDRAAEALADNPDKDEIIADLEQAIADKCRPYLTAHKDVISAAEIDKILAQMGPVGGEESGHKTEHAQEAAGNTSGGPKRLYQIREGAIISGVCNGIAAYLNVDVTLVRVIFVLFAFITSGGFILAYFIMMMLIPHANTPNERAQAMGQRPVTAQDLINRAKNNYAHFKNGKEWREWKRTMKQQRHQWKYQWQEERRARQYHSPLKGLFDFVGSLFWLLFLGFCVWLLYHHVPEVRAYMDAIPPALTRAGDALQSWWANR